ncbi:MAG: hypothetical protein KDC83_15125, partial [Flavobacteriales bacterium]|nr:hypothetical protein [Flavobacteriales bacterium]
MRILLHLLPIFFLTVNLSLNAQVKRVTTVPPLSNNNGSSGVSWNLQAGSSPIIIRDIGYLSYSGSYTYSIWYNPSPINNPSPGWAVNASGGWILIGNYTFTGNGTTVVSVTGSTMNFKIPANTTYGMAITSTSMPYMTYDASLGSTFTNNNECTILIGPGIGYGGSATSMSNHPRSFIGYVDYEVSQNLPNSAHISEICSPSSPMCGGLSNALSLKVFNDGKLPLDSITFGGRIHYQLGSVRDTFDIPDNKWKGHVASGEESSCQTIYNWSNGFRTGDSLYLWTKLPNGVVDSAWQDDTILFVIKPQMASGLYTIGDTLHDFVDLKSAFSTLCDTFGGICDTVIFELDSSSKGSFQYFGQYDICDVAGTSWNSPVIVRSNPNLATPITLWYDSLDKDNNYIVKFSGSHHMIFENLKFSAVDLGSYNNNYSGNVQLGEKSSDVRLVNCDFESDHKTSTSSNHTLVWSESNLGDNISIEDCDFSYGSIGVSLTNGSSHNIWNNGFKHQTFQGVSLSETKNSKVTSNDFVSLSLYISSASDKPSTFSSAIYLNNNKGALEVSNNVVKSSNSQWPASGITFDGHNALNQSVEVSNNSINIGQAWSSVVYHGIHCEGVKDVGIHYNSAAVTGNNIENAGVFASASSGIEMNNNIFASMLRGFAIDMASGGSVARSDYNDLYSPT